jgi:hypothetical protein
MRLVVNIIACPPHGGSNHCICDRTGHGTTAVVDPKRSPIEHCLSYQASPRTQWYIENFDLHTREDFPYVGKLQMYGESTLPSGDSPLEMYTPQWGHPTGESTFLWGLPAGECTLPIGDSPLGKVHSGLGGPQW